MVEKHCQNLKHELKECIGRLFVSLYLLCQPGRGLKLPTAGILKCARIGRHLAGRLTELRRAARLAARLATRLAARLAARRGRISKSIFTKAAL
jgi:hypothetical protein